MREVIGSCIIAELLILSEIKAHGLEEMTKTAYYCHFFSFNQSGIIPEVIHLWQRIISIKSAIL